MHCASWAREVSYRSATFIKRSYRSHVSYSRSGFLHFARSYVFGKRSHIQPTGAVGYSSTSRPIPKIACQGPAEAAKSGFSRSHVPKIKLCALRGANGG
jgi:hypothetical protein